MPKQLKDGKTTYLRDENENIVYPFSLLDNIFNSQGVNASELLRKLEIKINELKELISLNSTGGTVISEPFSDEVIEVDYPNIYKEIIAIRNDIDLRALQSDLELLQNLVNTLKQKTPIVKSFEPSGKETDVSIGQLYINTEKKNSYICTSVSPIIWTPIVDKVPQYIALRTQDPTNNEQGAFVGQLYINYKDNNYFVCTSVSLNTQTWQEIMANSISFKEVGDEVITINI